MVLDIMIVVLPSFVTEIFFRMEDPVGVTGSTMKQFPMKFFILLVCVVRPAERFILLFELMHALAF